MGKAIGIDLGTTNSVVAILQHGKPRVLPAEQGRPTLPSAVGLDAEGTRLVGTPARNQAILAPERTVLSIKRKMGEDVSLSLGSQELAPQEISAVILRTLKERAEAELGQAIPQAGDACAAHSNAKASSRDVAHARLIGVFSRSPHRFVLHGRRPRAPAACLRQTRREPARVRTRPRRQCTFCPRSGRRRPRVSRRATLGALCASLPGGTPPWSPPERHPGVHPAIG